MTRPTKEQVDRALSFVNDTEWAGHDPDDDIYGTLAAEVRALREERDFMESESRRWRESVAKLRAELSECRAQYASAAAASDAAELRIVELRAELEVERMRLAACGVAAHGAGDEHFAGMLPEYDSDALRATRSLAAQLRIVELRDEYADLEKRSLAALEQMTADAVTAIDGAGINADLAEQYAAVRAERDEMRAEVAELQAVNEDARRLNDMNDQLRATVERVEALKPAWLSRSRGLRILRAERQIGIAEGLRVCADDIEQALRGES